MLLSALFSLTAALSTLFTPTRQTDSPPLSFELRHQHAVSPSSRVVFSDVSRDSVGARAPRIVQTRRIMTHRSAQMGSYVNTTWNWSPRGTRFAGVGWDEEEVLGPDVEKRESLLQLAKMAEDAYVEPGDPQWYDLGSNWTASYPVGWEPDADGFRGYVFATPDNSTVVLSIKGTSSGLFGGGGPTTKKDKLNDNLLFSCCCARVDWSWTPVCDCYRGTGRCNQDCLEEALIEDSLFYPIGTNLYNNISYMYPDSDIWLIGHSLGGAISSFLGATFGVPVVTFEAPGERMAAGRLHLPLPPSTHHITHVYHTADPIPMGTCNGVLSSCSIAGYAMESRCHLGQSIVYDTVSNLSWSVSVRNHGIITVIENLLAQPWAPAEEIGREVPEPKAEDDCVECYSWDFGDFP